jgi:hypothetical protein
MCIEVMYVDAVFRYPLDIDFECTLFVHDCGHIVDELFGADSIDVVEHHSKGVWWFAIGDLVSFPMLMCFRLL